MFIEYVVLKMEKEDAVKLILVLAATVVLGFGLLKIYNSFYSSDTSATLQTQANEIASGEIKEIVIKGNEYSFTPSVIKLNKGDRVRIIFQNTGSIAHNFVINQLGIISRTIGPGQSETIEFIADKTGNFEFECSLPGHASAGMTGRVTIE